MAFSIDPAALNTHATTLRDLAGTTSTADTYLQSHLSLEFVDTSFLFARAGQAARDVRDTLTGLTASLNAALTASADELDATAARSVELDDAVEADLDAAYPDGPDASAPTVPPTGSAVYVTPSPPGDALVAPGGEPEMDLVSEILTTDWLSPSSVVAQILDWIFDWNYLDEITKNFSGDWGKMFTVSSAVTHTGGYVKSQGDNVSYAMSVGANSWTGEAATAANVFFTEMARILRASGDEISGMGPEFETVARGMQDAADSISGLFAQIMDAAIAAAVFYIAGTALVETVVGTVIGYLAGTGTLVYMAWLAEQAWEVIQAALLIFDILGAAVGSLQQFMIANPDLPTPTAYDNPDVP